MAVPTNTIQTFAMNRIREDLANIINLLDAYETPFYSAIGSEAARNRTPEWLAHKAPAPDMTNMHIEGDDAVNNTITQPTRYKNVVQLMNKVVQVSTTAEAVDSAGMKEMARNLLLHGITLKTELESFMTQNYPSVLGAAGTAAGMASIESWLFTNPIGGTGYAPGGFQVGTGLVNAPTDGTQRAITEALFKTAIKNVWVSGGKNLNILVGPTQKQNISGTFTGISTRYQTVVGTEQAKILGAADIYISDFGSHRIYPDRFNRNRTCLILDYSTWSKLWLQPLQSADLARTGNSTRKMLWCEATLKCVNEAANGALADLS